MPSFNPRARAGRDSFDAARRACANMFQSTRPRGARLRKRRAKRSSAQFQSTRPRGARLYLYNLLRAAGYGFNPRARAGRDFRDRAIRRVQVEFQSTRPRGARHVICSGEFMEWKFQSTRPRGARRRLLAACSRRKPCFNPRARAGRDV